MFLIFIMFLMLNIMTRRIPGRMTGDHTGINTTNDKINAMGSFSETVFVFLYPLFLRHEWLSRHVSMSAWMACVNTPVL